MLMLSLSGELAGSAALVPARRGNGGICAAYAACAACAACAGFSAGETSSLPGAVGAAAAMMGVVATLGTGTGEACCGTAAALPMVLSNGGPLNIVQRIPPASSTASKPAARRTHCRLATGDGSNMAIQSPIDTDRFCRSQERPIDSVSHCR